LGSKTPSLHEQVQVSRHSESPAFSQFQSDVATQKFNAPQSFKMAALMLKFPTANGSVQLAVSRCAFPKLKRVSIAVHHAQYPTTSGRIYWQHCMTSILIDVAFITS